MAYLNTPHLVFSGRFQADPSTVNNDPEHFDSATFRSNYQIRGSGPTNGWWNPRGTGAWRFSECTVKSVWYTDGTSCDDPSVDPVVGMPINGSENQVEGKIVDLDPEQQMVSEIWGFQVLLGDPKQSPGFSSDFEEAPFSGIWVRYPEGKPDSFFGAFYQSVLSNFQGNWEDISSWESSRFLKELKWKELCIGSAQLSIRFNVDGFQDDVNKDNALNPQFTFGRVVGAIGHYVQGEPKQFVLGRHLSPVTSKMNNAVATIDDDQLVVDLGNSLPTVSVGGDLKDFGHLYLALLPQNENPILLGEIAYRTKGWFAATAGIQAFKLSTEHAKKAKTTGIGIVQPTPNGPTIFLQETAIFVRGEPFVFRLNSNKGAKPGKAILYATKFGESLANQDINLAFDNSSVLGQVKQGPISGPPAGEPKLALSFEKVVTTNTDGKAEVELTATDPDNPRKYIDGQVYGVGYAVSGPAATSPAVSNQVLNVLVWDDYTVPEKPNWLRDVSPIFVQYANLYPIMRPVVDLANYASVVQRIGILKTVFNTPVTNPNYMPVTRDLSMPKREMIKKFLDNPVYMHCESIEDVKTALQQAIELEHATLPPYLSALYSIKPGRNLEVTELLRSIVLEEMLHMSLACNILIAIGGKPNIGKPGFVPRYPGPLPGGLRGNLTVHLRRCSIEQIRDVFLSIEEPEETIEIVDGTVTDKPSEPVKRHRYTIGWFYDQIKKTLEKLHEENKIKFNNIESQVSGKIGPHDLYKISSLRKAKDAIEEITKQGEGASKFNPAEKKHVFELSHYYKFSEIVHGRRIVIEDDSFSYNGEKIPFDSDGVYPMMDDPDTATLKPGTRARVLSNQFNQTYQALLNSLHQTFNGSPQDWGQAIGLMYSLNLAARKLVETASGNEDGSSAGPSFQTPL